MIPFSISQATAKEKTSDDGFSISLNYQGIGVQYGWEKHSLEARYQFFRETKEKDEAKTHLYGLRVNRYGATPSPRLAWYIGLETDVFSYQKSGIQRNADGVIVGVYTGVRQFLGRRLAFTFDVGPYFASAATQNGTSNQSDIVFNSSLEFHWGGPR